MAQRIPINIASKDRRLEYDIIEPDDNRISSGMSNEIGDDAKIEFRGKKVQKSLDVPPAAADFVLYVGGAVSLNLVSSWLYDKLKDKQASIRIGDETVDVDEDSIKAKLDEYWDD